MKILIIAAIVAAAAALAGATSGSAPRVGITGSAPRVGITGGGASFQDGVTASIARGKKLYMAQCLACHQVDGSGVMNMNPPLIKTTYVLGDKTALIRIVMEGMKTPLTIDDNEYHNIMPPHTTMSDQDIADVLTFVRHSFGNKATVVTAAEVKAIRTKDKVK